MAMEKKCLVINIGSTSKRYALYSGSKKLIEFHIDKLVTHFDSSFEYITNTLSKNSFIKSKSEIAFIGVRVVAPGDYFLEHRVINTEYTKKLSLLADALPLHIKPVLLEIKNIKKLFPSAKLVGVSDSAFHKNINYISRIYAMDPKLASKFAIFRFGYHGISFESGVMKLRSFFSKAPSNVVFCHLGGGCSVAAIRDGKSFDTSMGFSPVEGMFGSTRIGDIDPGALVYIARKLKLNNSKLENFINNECGFFGLCGKPDLRDVLKLYNSGDKNAVIALNLFAYRIKKLIGSFVSSLNGFDVLVFSGAIGFYSPEVRSMVCDNLNFFGVVLDEYKNKKLKGEGFVHKDSSKIKILVVKPDEMGIIAKETFNVIGF